MPHHPTPTSPRPTIDPPGAASPAPRSRTRARRLALLAMFAIYLALLIWVVLWKLEPPHVGIGGSRPVKLVPFVASGTAAASEPIEVFANLLLFLPLGVYLRLLAPSRGPFGATALAAAMSLGLECAQFALGVGSFDTTDIIVNALGGLVGFAVTGRALSARARRGGARAAGGSLAAATRWCALATCAAVLAAGAFAASPLRFAQPDAGPLAEQTRER